MNRSHLSLLIGAFGLAVASVASAESEPAQPSADRLIGAGYKVGNGIGFLGGDVFITPLPHLTLDLHAAYMTGFDSAFALAPAVQGHLWTGDRSTPYAGVGLQYARAKVGSVTADAIGYFANVGYEWKFRSGLGIQLGGGVQVLQKAEATDGVQMVSIEGGTNPNLEFGLRYRF
jgi:hypothetical protein